jgi:hypothetical protein
MLGIMIIMMMMMMMMMMIIIIIIIIICDTALFEPQPSLDASARLQPVFTSSDFATIIFLQSKAVSLASNPDPGGPGFCIYVSDRAARLYTQAPGGISV